MVDLAYDIVGSFIYCTGVYTFAKESGFSIGGFSGLGLIINHLTHLPVGILTLIFNIPVIIFSWKRMGKRFLAKSLKTILIQTAIMDFVMPLLPVYRGSPLLASLCTGILMGGGLVLVYMRGSSTGGTDFLILPLHKIFPHISIGQLSILMDGLILLLAALVYGNIDAALYGLIATFSCSEVMDRVLYGAGSGKMAMIISDHGQKIADSISRETDRGSTLVRARGTFSGLEHDLLLCACSKSQIYKVRESAHAIDPDAMVMITEMDEIYGEGFKKPDTTS